MQVFEIDQFQFPYDNLRFPGQHSEERILFVTREGKVVLKIKLILLFGLILLGSLIIILALNSITIFDYSFRRFIPYVLFVWGWSGLFIAWWIWVVYRKSVFIITTRRLTKFIHTTPWSRYQMSLGLDQIVDTGAYQKGFFQIFFGLGYFVARSAAGSIKNFKIINIGFAEDLHNYVNKLLFVFNEHQSDLDQFRPFISHLKGETRDEFVRNVAPKYAKKNRF